ncbi:MAG: PIN domain-containing protein [Rhizobiaceae bacterium]
MTLFVDTSVWSLAFRRDGQQLGPEVHALIEALASGDLVVTTGLVLQELLQGFSGPKAASELLFRFQDIPLIPPTRESHVAAAALRNHCRRNGIQVGTVDALIAQLCIENELTLLSTDQDFGHISRHTSLKLLAFRPQS